MLSRDTRVHLLALALAVALPATLPYVVRPGFVTVPYILVLAAMYGLVLAGAHLYLALRRDDGLLPVASRWRWVGTVALVLALGVATALAGGDRVLVDGVTLRSVAWALAGLSLVGSLVVEARDGYRASIEG